MVLMKALLAFFVHISAVFCTKQGIKREIYVGVIP